MGSEYDNMASPSFDFVRSPGVFAEIIFAVYLIIFSLVTYHILQIFKREGILYGHFSNVFDLLTDIRIWSIKHRAAYTTIVSGVLVSIFLVLVYWAERFHYLVYDAEPLFNSVTGFIQWATVLAVSALEKGSAPKSLLGLVLVGVFPLFIIGSVVTIVRYTSQDAHDRLMKQMAAGNLAPYRIIILNYQEKYDSFIETLLLESEAFVVLFAKEERLSDAESFKESFEKTSEDEYRLVIDELSYSTDFLFDQYEALRSDELYIFSDTELETDYRNLQLVTEINDAIKRKVERADDDSVKIPQTVWQTNDATISGISNRLDESAFQQHLHAVNFEDDIDNLVNINLGNPLENLNEFFNLSSSEDVPQWVRGYSLDEYSFTTSPLEQEEMDRLTDINRTRMAGAPGFNVRSEKEQLLRDIASRLDTDRSSPFYGVMVDVAGTDVPLDPSTAYSSYQFETARESIQITKENPESAQAPEQSSAADDQGDIFIINYNDNIHKLLRTHSQKLSDGVVDRDLFVFCSHEQVTPDSTAAVTYVTFETIPELLELLFEPPATEESTRQLAPGDTLLIFLDDTAAEPQINSLKIINAVNEKLRGGTVELTHNDILLAVESLTDAGTEEFKHLSVDKVLQTGKTEGQFLENLATLRTSDPVEALIYEGKLTEEEAFEWVTKTAYYFREYEIERAQDVYIQNNHSESAVGHRHRDLVADLRSFEAESRQLFVKFQLHREGPDQLTVDLAELTDDDEIEADDYLVFIPHL
jgi:hypothetical protein